MKIGSILKLIYHIIRGVISPTNLNHSVRAGSVLCASGIVEIAVEKIRSYPGGDEFFAKKNLFFNHGLDFFAKFPEGSLGSSYYTHLKKHNLDPDAFPKTPFHDDATYLEYLVRQSHDIWHVLTGFDVSIEGELGLQAFKAKQFNWPFSMVGIGGGSLVTLFKSPGQIETLIDAIARGQQLAAQSKPIMLTDWNQKWTVPFVEVRKELNLLNL